ncbi:ABC transporter permease [Peribacillus huizhouensis]|uniref:ABC-2 type transport system permease protein n=1 Tax=Peribacillus huizhouensis TaxID=1501239 RepID=A0ABR6CKN2_9BACI|nr:ABC transporter permease [Peribacillus huizhouensis]MBA9025548.1 ABC-2 type transport system permease protein [Peribacillus huizhouensis]
MGLLANEWVKIFKRKSSFIMIGILAIIVVVAAIGITFVNSQDNVINDNGNWQAALEEENKDLKEELKSTPGPYKKEIERIIAENEYRISHDMPKVTSYNVWTFMNGMMGLVDIVALFTIIIAAGIVASEFSWGTIKLLLIRPISRAKILLSKYITVLLYALFMLAILFVLSFILGAAFFGFEQNQPHLAYLDGQIVARAQIPFLLSQYALSSVGLLIFTTMAFMISAAFRNSSLAIGLSIFLLLMGSIVTSIIAGFFDWAKYLLFANTNLLPYFGSGTLMVEGMTLSFSLIVLLVYYIIFLVVAFWAFVKRDVAA